MNKLTLNEIVGYLPYGLKAEINGNEIATLQGISNEDENNAYFEGGYSLTVLKDQKDFDSWYPVAIRQFKPILNRIEDMSKEQLEQQYFIQSEFMYNIPLLAVELSRFYYSLHIDIHNLIDRGLAVDAKTLNTHTNVK